MSSDIAVAIIAATPATATFFLTAVVVWKAWHVPKTLGELVEHTNGLTEKLMAGSHEAGMQEQKDRGADEAAKGILAAAQVAADKIIAAAELAAAKLSKEGQ